MDLKDLKSKNETILEALVSQPSEQLSAVMKASETAREAMKRMMGSLPTEKLSGYLVSDDLLGLKMANYLKENDLLSQQFSKVIDQNQAIHKAYEQLKLPEPPRMKDNLERFENPIHETNRRLNYVLDMLENMHQLGISAASLLRSLNDAGTTMLVEANKNAESARKFARLSIWMALAALVASMVGGGAELFAAFSSNDNSELVTAFNENNAQNERLRKTLSQMSENQQNLANAINNLTMEVAKIKTAVKK